MKRPYRFPFLLCLIFLQGLPSPAGTGMKPNCCQCHADQCNKGNLVKPGCITSPDYPVIEEAFLHGYIHNLVAEDIGGEKIRTLSIQCTDEKKHKVEGEMAGGRNQFSVWTRDLYWGFLGWSQAGDDKVLDLMRSSLDLLILAKNKNQALGQSPVWPLNDERFYIPQAYTTGLKIAMDFFPWCSESQADFLLLAYNYWKMSGDSTYIASIWPEIVYVTRTLEMMDTDGNALPDALWGSYDYMWLKTDSEEPLMCAKASLAYRNVAELARMLGLEGFASRILHLADAIRVTMNRPVEEGGLWKREGNGGYYVQMRSIKKGSEGIEERFIPYDNLVPMWCGMTDPARDEAIFDRLDRDFEGIYDLTYGPMYCAPAGHNETSVMDCSSVTWLAFLDIYLRGKSGHEKNRDRIYELLMQHAGDAGGIPFPEGAGVYGNLTGGSGRAWDNGNFFHMLVCGIYGIEKSAEGISLSPPSPIGKQAVTILQNVCWREAVYRFNWSGAGKAIKQVTCDGREVRAENGRWLLTGNSGQHTVEVLLGKE